MAGVRKAPRLTAMGWIREMQAGESGGSEPHLFQTEAGDYLVKASNNPQGPIVLVNELVAGLCFDYLGVDHPSPAIVDIPPEVIADNQGAKFKSGTPLAHGLAFGSEYWQSDPEGTVSGDLVVNGKNRAATMVADTWVGAHDSRQGRVRRASAHPGKYDHFPVDQGHSLGNPNWDPNELSQRAEAEIKDAPGLQPEEIAEVLDRLAQFSESEAVEIVNQVPDQWLDQGRKSALVKYLVSRAQSAVKLLREKHRTGGA